MLVIESIEHAEYGDRLTKREPCHRLPLPLGEIPRTTERRLDLVRELGLGLDTDQQANLRYVPFPLLSNREVSPRGAPYVLDHPPCQTRERQN